MIERPFEVVNLIRAIHATIRDSVVEACEQASIDELASITGHQAGDTIFVIDKIAESELLKAFGRIADVWPSVIVAEGLGATGIALLPNNGPEVAAALRIIVDPIDGTRGLMYQKRSAWILTGVAPNKGDATSLADIELAVQTEIPLVKQHLSDVLWAVARCGAEGERVNRLTGETTPLVLRPSRAESIEQGYGSIVRFFPGGRAELASLDDQLVERLLGPVQEGRILAFEDQYISTGGQLYELAMGHDRWLADLRPLVRPTSACCHPYDLCTELIAREAGVLVTGLDGHQLAAPLDVATDIAWVGYANKVIAAHVHPVLLDLLNKRRLA